MASPFGMPDEFVQGFFKSGQNLLQAFASRPDITASPIAKAQAHYWEQQMALWMGMLASAASGTAPSRWWPPSAATAASMPRSGATIPGTACSSRPTCSTRGSSATWSKAPTSTRRQKHKLRFFTRQFIDSMSPANFAATNPEALKLAFESKGESMRAGFANLLEDLRRGRISITDETAFEVGRNVAVSEGSVVFENELFQLIQYAPLTDTGRDTAAADRAAVHQQVLHPRPAARELVRALRLRAGADGVPGVVAQPAGRTWATPPGTTTSSRAR